MILAKNKKEISDLYTTLWQAARKRGLFINVTKTKFIVVSTTNLRDRQDSPMDIDNKGIDRIHEVKYLCTE